VRIKWLLLLLTTNLFILCHICEVWSKTHPGKAKTHHQAAAAVYHPSSQLAPAVASQLTQIETQLKELQERPTLSLDQYQYINKLYDNRTNADHWPITQEQADYLKNLYDNKNDFKTLLEAEDKKLDAEEVKFSTKVLQDENDTKGKIDGFEKTLMEAETKYSDTKSSIWNNYFTVFGTILAVFGTFSAIGWLLLKDKILKDLLENANAQIRGTIEETAIYEADVSIADAFYRLIDPIWQIYEKDYQKFLREKFLTRQGDSKNFIRDVRLAKLFARRGLNIVDQKSVQERMDDHERATCVHAGLINNFVYHETAEILCSPAPAGQDRIDKVLTEANECLKMSKNEMVYNNEGTEWFACHETVASTFIRLGDASLQRQGRKIMSDVLTGKTPGPKFKKPPVEWLQYIWDECFFKDANGVRQDPLGLGNIPRP
jgi:hypothetical protein